MTLVEIGAILLALMFVLLAAGVWIGMTLAIVGGVGMVWFTTLSTGVTAKNLFTAFWNANASWELAALPLFIWMGEILFRTKLSEQMFTGLAPWLNRVPGRLMHTTILGCGIFGSVSGSSAATCATISKVALPELMRRGYDERIALGSLATAGTLGILIPPSITMVVYAVAAEASIIRIFLAGFLPGLLLMVLFSGYIAWWAWRHPELQPPPEPPTTFAEKIRRSGQLIPCMLLIVFIVIVLVAGWATATECAAYGVLGSLILAWTGGSLDRRSFIDSLMGATRVSCMIMFILAGAKFLSMTMGYTGIPRALAEWVAVLDLPPYGADRGAVRRLHRPRHGARRHLDDRADLRGRAADDPEGGLRPHLVRHLHRAAGRDRGGDAAGRLQPLRPAEHDRARQQHDREDVAALLRAARRLHRADHRVPGDRDLASRRGDGRRKVGAEEEGKRPARRQAVRLRCRECNRAANSCARELRYMLPIV